MGTLTSGAWAQREKNVDTFQFSGFQNSDLYDPFKVKIITFRIKSDTNIFINNSMFHLLILFNTLEMVHMQYWNTCST